MQSGLFSEAGFPYTEGMQQNTERHPLIVPLAAFALAGLLIVALTLTLYGWQAHGAEMIRALSASALSWCM